MSNAVLPRAILSAPLVNGIGRYVNQLQRITIKFCKSTKSSLGARDYIEKHMIDFAQECPGTVVYLKPRRHRSPLLVAEYLNGHWQYVHITGMSPEEIRNWMEHLRTRSGNDIRPRTKNQRTFFPSIQGVWYPDINAPSEQVALSLDNKLLLENLTTLSAVPPAEPTATDIVRFLYNKQQLRFPSDS